MSRTITKFPWEGGVHMVIVLAFIRVWWFVNVRMTSSLSSALRSSQYYKSSWGVTTFMIPKFSLESNTLTTFHSRLYPIKISVEVNSCILKRRSLILSITSSKVLSQIIFAWDSLTWYYLRICANTSCIFLSINLIDEGWLIEAVVTWVS